jgi:fatty-acyl-CoA synthase
LSYFHLIRDPRGVLTAVLDAPGRKYNVLGEEAIAELQTLLDAWEHDPTVRLLLFRSGKESGFIAGADLRELYAITSPQTADQISNIGQKLFGRLQRLAVPTVAAIHGPCLGGGLEFALACRYRIARDDATTRLGLPEIAFGLVPAWGGTQRLRKRVGLAAALSMILNARKVSVRRAAALGLVDRVWPPEQFVQGVEQFVAERLARQAFVPPRPGLLWQLRKPARLGQRIVLRAARARVAARSGTEPALAAARSAALQAVEQGLRHGFAAGLASERRAFAELLFTPACRGRIGLFLQRRQAGQADTGGTGFPGVESKPQLSRPNTTPLACDSVRDEPGAAPVPWVAGLTIGAALRATARQFADRDAIVFPQAGVRLTWEQFDRAVDRVARGLLALGFQRGDHFGIWSTNWPEWVILQFATARIGVVLVTINPAYQTAELAYALAQSDVRGLALVERFKSSRYFAMLGEACPEIETYRPGALRSANFPRLQWVIRLRGGEHPGMLAWQDLEAAGEGVPASALEQVQGQLQPGDPINLQYTSGTTGAPKGALLSHRNLLWNAFYAARGQRLDERDRICIPVPLYHCFGCVLGTMCAAVSGAAMVFPQESFDAEQTLAAVEGERCTAIYGVPTMFILEMQHASFRRRDTSSLRTGIMAGSPCPIEIMKRVVQEMGARQITIAYGQTEASPLVTMTSVDDPLEKRVGTVGRPFPGIEVKIVDLLSGAVLPDGRAGELCCRGHNVMLGYYHLPDCTAQAIDRDGWLHTGDVALRQPDGYFRITGRIKEMIIRGGENIAPREIEELLYQHPKVEQVSVVGVPDPKFGEEILAWIKLHAGAAATENEFRDFCRGHLAHFKTPRYVKFVDSFPATVTGKIQKYKIRQQAIEELGLQRAAAVETA